MSSFFGISTLNIDLITDTTKQFILNTADSTQMHHSAPTSMKLLSKLLYFIYIIVVHPIIYYQIVHVYRHVLPIHIPTIYKYAQFVIQYVLPALVQLPRVSPVTLHTIVLLKHPIVHVFLVIMIQEYSIALLVIKLSIVYNVLLLHIVPIVVGCLSRTLSLCMSNWQIPCREYLFLTSWLYYSNPCSECCLLSLM